MASLFRRLQANKKLRLSVNTVAKLLKVASHIILRVECWQYVVFIHRSDCGGQFISYRKFKEWQNAVACQIQNCEEIEQLQNLWKAIEIDWQKYQKQYDGTSLFFIKQLWLQRWKKLTRITINPVTVS